MTKINFEIPALLLSCKSLDFLVYKINCTNLVQNCPPQQPSGYSCFYQSTTFMGGDISESFFCSRWFLLEF